MDYRVVQVGQGHVIGNSRQHHLYQACVGGGGVAEAKGHLGELKGPPRGSKRRLVSVLLGDWNHVISAGPVDAAEYRGAAEPRQVILDVPDWMGVFDCDVVEGTIIDAPPDPPILLRGGH